MLLLYLCMPWLQEHDTVTSTRTLQKASRARASRGPSTSTSTHQKASRAHASRGPATSTRSQREHHRPRPARKLSLNCTSNLSFLFSLPERRELFPLIPRFACTSRRDPREAISRALTTSRAIAPSGLVRAQIQHTSDGAIALGGWVPTM